MTEVSMICYLWNIDKQLLFEIEKIATFGRVIEATILLEDENLSRLHFKLEYRKVIEEIPPELAGLSETFEPIDEFAFHVEDLNSSNGTKCNSYLIKEPVKLTPGDIIEAGSFRYMYLTLEAITQNDKNSLAKLVPGFLPESFREEIKVKTFAFYKFVYEQMQLFLKRRQEREEKKEIFDQRFEELKVVDQKKSLIDQKKLELDQMYAEKLSLINEKYQEVEKFRISIFEKFKPGIKIQTQKISEINNKLGTFQSQFFIGIFDDENDLDSNE